jgi:hypothetical protein
MIHVFHDVVVPLSVSPGETFEAFGKTYTVVALEKDAVWDSGFQGHRMKVTFDGDPCVGEGVIFDTQWLFPTPPESSLMFRFC